MKYRWRGILVGYAVAVLVIFNTMICPRITSAVDVHAEKPLHSQDRPLHYYKKQYNFTTNWFTPHIPKWKEILASYKGKPDVNYLEIGVFEGRAMIWMLENILTHPTARATAVDIFPEGLEQRFTRNLKRSGYADKVTVIKGSSQIVLKDLPIHTFDIIYVDGDHSAPAVLADAVLSWLCLKEGGIIIFDDYKYKLEERPPEQRPLIAIDAFVSSYSEYIDTVFVESQYVIRKKERISWESFSK